jgi:16S rRNA G527 N7-methylase RsmG
MAMPELEVCLVEASAKKAAFLKHAVVRFGLHPRVRVCQLFARGQPEAEGLMGFEAVTSRAFMELGAFLPLAKNYARPGGRVLGMLGKADAARRPEWEALAVAHGCRLVEFRCFRLKPSGHERALVHFERT